MIRTAVHSHICGRGDPNTNQSAGRHPINNRHFQLAFRNIFHNFTYKIRDGNTMGVQTATLSKIAFASSPRKGKKRRANDRLCVIPDPKTLFLLKALKPGLQPHHQGSVHRGVYGRALRTPEFLMNREQMHPSCPPRGLSDLAQLCEFLTRTKHRGSSLTFSRRRSRFSLDCKKCQLRQKDLPSFDMTLSERAGDVSLNAVFSV